MNQSTAQMIVIIGTLVGIGVWLIGFWLLRKMQSKQPLVSHAVLMAEESIDQSRKAVLKILAAQPQWRITERSDTRIIAEMYMNKLTVTFAEAEQGTNAHFTVDLHKSDWIFLLIMRLCVLMFAPIVLLGLPYVLLRFAVPSSQPGMQWQSVQIAQIIHVLWPPFVVYFTHKSMRGHVARLVENMALNLEVNT